MISEQKKKENIAEYVLYMWQMEDLLRGSELNLEKVMRKIFPDANSDDDMAQKYQDWFSSLIDEMNEKGIQKEGHLSTVKHYMKSMEDLHRSLLTTFQDDEYKAIYRETLEHINVLKGKSASDQIGDVEICLTGLYGLMLLKIKQAKISDETLEAIGKISKMVAYLSASFNKLKIGELKLPSELKN